MVSIKPSERNQGIAEKLVKKRLEWMVEKEAEIAVTFAWSTKSNGCHMHTPLTKNNMVHLETIPEFWSKVVTDGNTCPECGSRCECEMHVYYIELNN